MLETQKIHDVTIQKIAGTIEGNPIDNSKPAKKRPIDKKQSSKIVFHKGESDGHGPNTIGL